MSMLARKYMRAAGPLAPGDGTLLTPCARERNDQVGRFGRNRWKSIIESRFPMLEHPFFSGSSGSRRVAAVAGLVALFALAALVVGCEDAPAVPTITGANQVVKGKVLLDNGKPLTKGRVVLLPDQEPMLPLYGDLNPDGSFTLKAGGLVVGVSYGQFRVSIEPGDRNLSGRGKSKSAPFPAKYLSTDNGLTVKITADTKELPTIELK
jgi:hypothetical protein